MKKKMAAKKGSNKRVAPAPQPKKKAVKVATRKHKPEPVQEVEIVVAPEPHIEVTMALPEVPVRHVTKCLPCEHCGKPVNPAELAVVLEWGEKPKDAPTCIGRPWKRLAHIQCDREARGIKPKERRPQESSEKPPSTPTTRAPRQSAGKPVGKIYRIVKTNPRKEGTHGWNSFNLVKDGMTVEQYLAAGGRMNDLRWDMDHQFVEVK